MKLLKFLGFYFFLFLVVGFFSACGDDSPSSKQSSAEKLTENESSNNLATNFVEKTKQAASATGDAVKSTVEKAGDVAGKAASATGDAVKSTVEKAGDVAGKATSATGDAIKSTAEKASDVAGKAASATGDVVKSTLEKVANVGSGDKPYQVVDGKISKNAIEGWKTFNGGGCGACHGRGGGGGVAPDLGLSVTEKLSKEQFVEIITNGKSGTFMKPFKRNKRVMSNIDNLYAYFKARGDGVLGSGNLIKLPLGK